MAACTQPTPEPSILVIVVDTLRADHVGSLAKAPDSPTFAGRGSPTPSIDRWAAGGARFVRAVTPAPFTMPAMAALWTGVYPDRTGVVAHEPGTTLGTWPGGTLAEAARQAGMATAAVVANPWLARRSTGFDRGFGEFTRLGGPDRTGNRRRGDAVTKEAIDLLNRLADQRFLLWVHYFDPHMPYAPPVEFAQAAGAQATPGRVVTEFRKEGRDLRRIYRGEGFSPKDIEQARRLYEGEVRYADAQVGRLLDHLANLGLAEQTIVLLASDHGESLGEHGLYFAHDHTLYQELIRAALVVAGPDVRPGIRRDRVSLIDVTPTLCRMASLECEDEVDGRDLFDESGQARTLFAAATPLRLGGPNLVPGQIPGLKGRSLMALRGRTKLLRTPTSSGPFFERYNLATDPGEAASLVAKRPATRSGLAKELAAWRAEMKSARPQPAPTPGPRRAKQESEALRSLGYLQ